MASAYNISVHKDTYGFFAPHPPTAHLTSLGYFN